MAKESKFGYVRRTPEQLKSVMSRRGGGFDSWVKRDYPRYKMRPGKNRVRFIQPTWENADHFALEVFLNYEVGPDKQTYLSLSKMGRGKDPLDEARRDAIRTGDQGLAKQLNPGRRWLAWVIDRFDVNSEAKL